MNGNFTHLHVHSEHSVLDGMGKVEELVKYAKEMGQEAIALSDHGSMGGLYELKEACEKYGLKPIYACEFYLRLPIEDKLSHLLLIAENNEGLKNLYQLLEKSYVSGFYKKPAITLSDLQVLNKGLICLTGCLANIIPRSLVKGDKTTAKEYIQKLKELFNENLFLEVQCNTLMEQAVANKELERLGKEMDIKLVATNDVHYVFKEDADTHDVLLAIQTKKKMNDPKRWSFPSKDYWLKSREEMSLNGLSKEAKEQALNETLRIAEMCHATIESGDYKPIYAHLTEEEAQATLKRCCERSLQKKFIPDKDYNSEMMHELDVIAETGYTHYTLVVADMIRMAKQNGILVGDSRGSGGGSKVNYLMGITKMEPKSHELIFERYLDRGRIPDIDVDFSDNIAVMKLLQQKYGESNVARIVARGKMAPKAVIRKVFAIFGYSQSLIAQISGCIGNDVSIDTLEKAYAKSSKLVEFKKKYPKEFHIIERLEGRISHTSKHAGGIVIYEGLNKIAPLHTEGDDRSMRILSWDKYEVEKHGLVKIDALGLTALEQINDTLKMVGAVEGEVIDLKAINYNDEAVYEDLCNGDVLGVFQLNNQSGLTKKQQPKTFDDLVALSAVIRPGTCNINDYLQRRQSKNYTLPPEREHLRKSEGLIIYQEQYLQDCKVYANWHYGFSDKHVRKNKNIKEDFKLNEQFLEDGVANGYDVETLQKVWDEIVSIVAGGYSFNLSHSVGYTYITYRTAYLKHYYTTYFLASILNKVLTMSGDNKEAQMNTILSYAKQKGIKLHPPNLNTSSDVFTADKTGIYLPLTMINGLGDGVMPHIKQLRPIHSFSDLLNRSTKTVMRINVIESLIKSGTFDEEGYTRPELLNRLYTIRKNKKTCLDEDSSQIRMKYEHEALGVYLTNHPLDKYAFRSLSEQADGENCLIAGIITKIDILKDKQGRDMAFIFLDTMHTTVKVIVFASVWKKKIARELQIKQILMVRGKRSGVDCLLNSYEILEGNDEIQM